MKLNFLWLSWKPQLGGKTQAKAQKQQENETVKQIKSFADELKHSGTIDFILSDTAGTVVLSAQEQYLSNDNISEIIGGHFKVLGKVIAICKDETENIDLLRKTTLSILPIDLLTESFSGFQNDDTKQFNLPELKTQISGPAVIVIPVAIYAWLYNTARRSDDRRAVLIYARGSDFTQNLLCKTTIKSCSQYCRQCSKGIREFSWRVILPIEPKEKMRKWAKSCNFALFASFLPTYNLCVMQQGVAHFWRTVGIKHFHLIDTLILQRNIWIYKRI